MAFDLEGFYDLKWPQLTEIWNFIFPWRNNRSHKDWFWRTRQLYLTKLTKFSKKKINKNSSQNVKLWNIHYPSDNKNDFDSSHVICFITWHSEKMLVTSCHWQRYVDDFMMLTDLRSWWQNYYVGDFLNVKNRLPKSQIGQTLKHVNCSH